MNEYSWEPALTLWQAAEHLAEDNTLIRLCTIDGRVLVQVLGEYKARTVLLANQREYDEWTRDA